jgi:hypothetical protein
MILPTDDPAIGFSDQLAPISAPAAPVTATGISRTGDGA